LKKLDKLLSKNIIEPIFRYWRQFFFTLDLIRHSFIKTKIWCHLLYSIGEARWLIYISVLLAYSHFGYWARPTFSFGSFYNKLLTIRSSPKSKGVSRYMEIGLIRIAKTLKNFFLLLLLPPHRSIHLFWEFSSDEKKKRVNLLIILVSHCYIYFLIIYLSDDYWSIFVTLFYLFF
jgi:hypothetical protein